ANLLTGKSILNGWRLAVFIIAFVSALATPTADPMSMFLLMAPLSALYFLAVGIALANDKRRERKQAKLLAEDLEID
ncbi:MAG: twin-arginine translocase subunit TatC, partial [Actinomycetota bacterium]